MMEMKKERVRSILAVSALTLIGMTPILTLVAQSEDSNVAERILAIYDQARELALRWASRAEQLGREDIANELRMAVEEADTLIEQAREELASGNEDMAAELAKEAINRLKEVLMKAKEEYTSSNLTRSKERLLSAIRRLNRVIQRLEEVLRKLESSGVNVEEPRQKLERAKEMLEDALEFVNEGKLEKAKEMLKGAADLLREVFSWIRDHIDDVRREKIQRKVQRIISAAEKTIERLQKLEEWLIQHNRTEAAAKVAEAREALSRALDRFREAIKEEDYAAAREALREMVGILRRIRQYMMEYRSRSPGTSPSG